MTPPARRSVRRTDALSKDRIVGAAIAILDEEGSADATGLTLRTVMTRLGTGSGAIYHHVSTMDELRAAAADDVLRTPLQEITGNMDPDDALRAIALATFESIRAHPWVGIQLARNSLQPAVIRLWKAIGVQLERRGLRGASAAAAGSTLASFVLGSAAQFSARSSLPGDEQARKQYLDALAEEWVKLDDGAVVQDIASQLREHDDRQQFLDGVDIILRGIV